MHPDAWRDREGGSAGDGDLKEGLRAGEIARSWRDQSIRGGDQSETFPSSWHDPGKRAEKAWATKTNRNKTKATNNLNKRKSKGR